MGRVTACGAHAFTRCEKIYNFVAHMSWTCSSQGNVSCVAVDNAARSTTHPVLDDTDAVIKSEHLHSADTASDDKE